MFSISLGTGAGGAETVAAPEPCVERPPSGGAAKNDTGRVWRE